MSKRNRKNASRGSVNNIILESLYSGQKYGYEIIKEIEEKTDGKIVLKQPSLYSSLTRFEDKGYVTSSWADSNIGGRRHYYQLTPEGRTYYEDNVLNKKSSYSFLNDDYEYDNSIDKNNSSEDDIDENDEYNIDTYTEEDIDYNKKYDFNVQDRINELLNDNNKENLNNKFTDNSNNSEEFFTTINEQTENIEDDMYIFNETDTKEQQDDNEYDIKEEELEQHSNENNLIDNIQQIHSSYSYNNSSNNTIKYSSDHSEELSNIYNSIISNNNDEDYTEESPIVREQKKQESMKILYGERNDKDVENKQSKYTFNESKPKYYIDENGITKQYVLNENAEEIQNNYLSTIQQSNMFNSSDFDEILKKSNNRQPKKKVEEKQEYVDINDIDDETIAKRNLKFQEKFNSIAENYMNKSTDNQINDSQQENEYPIQNNIEDNDDLEDENYVEFDNENTNINNNENEESYYFSYNKEEKQDEQKTIQPDKDIKISEYNYSSTNVETYNNNYIKINKAKFICGLVMLILMLTELTVSLFILKSNYNLTNTDNVIYIIGYLLVIAISCFLILPFFLNPNKRKLNTFRFTYNLTLGILSFFVLITLTYAINSFIGFEIDNIQFFMVKLFVPIILSFNLIIWPIVYKIVSSNKSLY